MRALFLSGLDDGGGTRVVGQVATCIGIPWRAAIVGVWRLDTQGGNRSVELGHHFLEP
jgi:hypothetical protein